MLSVQNVAISIGARQLLNPASFHVQPGDKVGLVGRNGAGKTTLTKVLSRLMQPDSGHISVKGKLAILPQDPAIGDAEQRARTRILDGRDLGKVSEQLENGRILMENSDGAERQKHISRYSNLLDRFEQLGGYASEAEASAIAANLGLDETVLDKPLGVLSGGQRRRIELARILFSKAETMILDEPTNHLDVDSVRWLRDFLSRYQGALLIISHDEHLMSTVVNRVFYLDANRQVLDIYNMGWKHYLRQRQADQERRLRERTNAEKKASALKTQAERFGAKATKARAAQQMVARADRLLANLEEERVAEQVAQLRFPTPAPCGKVPLSAQNLSKNYGSLEVFSDVSLAIDRASRVVIMGLNGAGKTTLLKILGSVEYPDLGSVTAGHGLKIGYYAQEHETLDTEKSLLENLTYHAEHITELEARNVLGSFLFQGDDVYKPAGVLSGGEKTRLALAILVVSSANVLLLDEPTNNLDPQSRAHILEALKHYQGAIVLVSHDEGAVKALNPERVLIMPEGDEDHWSSDYEELIALS